MACINHTICVCTHRQTETDINKMKQMVDMHLCVNLHVIIDFFQPPPFTLHYIPPGKTYLFTKLLVFAQMEGKKILYNSVSILEYLFFFFVMG